MDTKAVAPTLGARLKRGLLEVFVDDLAGFAQAPFGIAERRNPRRAFLFVSRVLGRHVPVRPSVMAASLTRPVPGRRDGAGPPARMVPRSPSR